VLTTTIEGLLEEDFRDRIVPFDRTAARAYASIAAA
jgi:predicted nucleic acid-binding protein